MYSLFDLLKAKAFNKKYNFFISPLLGLIIFANLYASEPLLSQKNLSVNRDEFRDLAIARYAAYSKEGYIQGTNEEYPTNQVVAEVENQSSLNERAVHKSYETFSKSRQGYTEGTYSLRRNATSEDSQIEALEVGGNSCCNRKKEICSFGRIYCIAIIGIPLFLVSSAAGIGLWYANQQSNSN